MTRLAQRHARSDIERPTARATPVRATATASPAPLQQLLQLARFGGNAATARLLMRMNGTGASKTAPERKQPAKDSDDEERESYSDDEEYESYSEGEDEYESKQPEPEPSKLALTLPDGRMLRLRFDPGATVDELRQFVLAQTLADPRTLVVKLRRAAARGGAKDELRLVDGEYAAQYDESRWGDATDEASPDTIRYDEDFQVPLGPTVPGTYEHGWGPTKKVVYDADWTDTKKQSALSVLDPSGLLGLLENMASAKVSATVTRAESLVVIAEVMKRLDDLSRNQLVDLQLVLGKLAAPAELRRIVSERAVHAIPKRSTGGSPPQKKTPKGQTRSIHMNYVLKGAEKTRSDTQYGHFKFFRDMAARLGLEFNITTDAAGQADLERDGSLEGVPVNWTITEHPVSEWAEDSVEFLANEKTAVLEKHKRDRLERGLIDARKQRWQELITDPRFKDEPYKLGKAKDWVAEGVLVNETSTGELREKALRSRGEDVPHIRAYLEGGNIITGEDAKDDTVVLVGRDAIAATAAAYGIDGDAARMLICDDFGLLSVDHVILVEQPGKFHLDMGLLFIGDGKVIVNDSHKELLEASARLKETPEAEGLAEIVAKLELQSGLEEAAVKDLTRAGMVVLRYKLEDKTSFNFFNGEFVFGADGRIYYLTNGAADVKRQEWFKELLVNELEVVTDVFFTDQSLAAASLRDQGGVGCRIKGSPRKSKN